MLIKVGPTELLRGRDWGVAQHTRRNRLWRSVFAFWVCSNKYGAYTRRMINLAATAYGFDVNANGDILNWDAVPHLHDRLVQSAN